MNYSLYLVTDRNCCKHRPLEELVSLAIEGGVSIVQLREKQASIAEILHLGRRLKILLKKNQIPLIINDRVDIAMALDADGVHLGQSDMSYHHARKLLGNNKIIGLSVSNEQQVIQANDFDVDYLGIGPIFPTTTKKDAKDPLGISNLKKLRQLSRHQLIAIGGINLNNISEVIPFVDGVAMASAILTAESPREISSKLANIIRNNVGK